MPLKKSDLYSSPWASRDELRRGMDGSQSRDYPGHRTAGAPVDNPMHLNHLARHWQVPPLENC